MAQGASGGLRGIIRAINGKTMQDNMTYLIIIGAAVVALAALAALVNYVMSIVRGFQEMRHAENPPRNPPLPEEVAKAYATKRELAELRQELADSRRELAGEIAELKRDISVDLKDLQKEIKAERSRVDDSLKQQFDLIRDLTAKDNEWHQSVNLMLGRIEGKVNGK